MPDARRANLELDVEKMEKLVKELEDKLKDHQKQIADLRQGRSTVGMVIPYAGSISTDQLKEVGWLLCDGSELPINDEYRLLFGVIGNAFGGDGNATFRVPNLQGRVAVGASREHARGDTFGNNTHTLTGPELPDHAHNIAEHSHRWENIAPNAGGINFWALAQQTNLPGLRSFNQNGGIVNLTLEGSALAAADYYTEKVPLKTADTVDKGHGAAFSIVPPSLALNFLIRYK